MSTWCPGVGPPDSHDEPDAHGGGWGDRGWSGAPAFWFKGLAQHPHGRLTQSAGGVSGAFDL